LSAKVKGFTENSKNLGEILIIFSREERGVRREERDMLYALLNSPPFGGVGGGCYYSLTTNL
jgi:hypothetical protein